jgi:hypothetical protein
MCNPQLGWKPTARRLTLSIAALSTAHHSSLDRSPIADSESTAAPATALLETSAGSDSTKSYHRRCSQSTKFMGQRRESANDCRKRIRVAAAPQLRVGKRPCRRARAGRTSKKCKHTASALSASKSHSDAERGAGGDAPTAPRTARRMPNYRRANWRCNHEPQPT